MKEPKIGIVMGTGATNMRMLGGDGQAQIKFPITTAPVLTGTAGRAWLCDEASGIKKMGARSEDHAGLSHWVMEAPGYHPAWHSYSLVLVHLRPLPKGGDTLIYLDGATHELWLYALNPDIDLNSMVATGLPSGAWLHPKNFAAQFIEVSDDLARERVKNTVQKVLDGNLSPDTDYTHVWSKIWGNNMLKDRPNYRPPVVRR